jgi:hypothetical protein
VRDPDEKSKPRAIGRQAFPALRKADVDRKAATHVRSLIGNALAPEIS